MSILLQDLRFAIRMLVKNPVFTIVILFTIGLGSGANTVMFSLVDTILVRPLPYADPDRLVLVRHSYPSLKDQVPISAPGYMDYKTLTNVFESSGVFAATSLNATDRLEPERLIGRLVSIDMFATLKVNMVIGRAFVSGEDQLGNNHVVILTNGLWKRRFGSDPNILNKTMLLDGNSYKIVGVLPPDFQFGQGVELYLPLVLTNEQLSNDQRGREWLIMIARLKPDVTLAQAESEMDILSEQVKEKNEGRYPDAWKVALKPLNLEIVGKIRPMLLVLFGAAFFVLLIASTNTINLLLTRALSRQKEIALRLALGASRARLVRQLITESVLLSLLGGALGLILASFTVNLLLAVNRPNIPRADEIGLDYRILGFTFLTSLVMGTIFGLAPIFQIQEGRIQGTLKESSRTSSGSKRQNKFRNLLVVSEIALALVLLVGAGLMIRTLVLLLEVKPGFRTDNMITMQVSLPRSKYREPGQITPFYRQAFEQVSSIPLLSSASLISHLPLSGSSMSGGFIIQGRSSLPGDPPVSSDRRAIMPNYFQTMGIPLLQGRDFTLQDTTGSPPVAIVDQELARTYWPNENALGKRISYEEDNGEPYWREIVGIVGQIKSDTLDGEIKRQLYIPHGQLPVSDMFLVARTSMNPTDVVPAIKIAIQSVDPNQPVYNVRTMEQYIDRSLAQRRFSMVLLAVFGGIAIILAGIGLYGVMSYSVTRRTHEIGVRMALGAQSSDVLKLVVGQGMVITIFGIVVGLISAFALTHLMSSLLYEVSATDPATFIMAAAFLLIVALLATFIPARRATRIDPISALRIE